MSADNDASACAFSRLDPLSFRNTSEVPPELWCDYAEGQQGPSPSSIARAVREPGTQSKPRQVQALTLTDRHRLRLEYVDDIGDLVHELGGGLLVAECASRNNPGHIHLHGFVSAKHAEQVIARWCEIVPHAAEFCQDARELYGRGVRGWLRYIDGQRRSLWRAYGAFAETLRMAQRRCICGESLGGRRRNAQSCSDACRKRLERRRGRSDL